MIDISPITTQIASALFTAVSSVGAALLVAGGIALAYRRASEMLFDGSWSGVGVPGMEVSFLESKGNDGPGVGYCEGLERHYDLPSKAIRKQLLNKRGEGLLSTYYGIEMGAYPLESERLDSIRAQYYNLVDKAQALGVPSQVVDRIDTFELTNSTQFAGVFTAHTQLGETRKSIGMDVTHVGQSLFNEYRCDVAEFTMVHELGHSMDFKVRQPLGGPQGGTTFYSLDSPLFEVSSNSVKGEAAKEMYRAYKEDKEGLAYKLSYPFKGMEERQIGPESATKEIYAQAAGLYYTEPHTLQRVAPKTFEVLKGVDDAYRQEHDNESLHQRLRKAFRI